MINLIGRTDAMRQMAKTKSPIIRFVEKGQTIHEEMKAIAATANTLKISVTQATCRIVVDERVPVLAVMVRLKVA